jgi:RecA-family ATPase
MGGFARAIGGAVVTSAHTSQAGAKSGTGESGSTEWDGVFRSRLYLVRPKAEQGTQPDQYARTLYRKKANWALREDQLDLRWQHGVFTRPGTKTGIIGSIERRACERVFLDLLDKMSEENQHVSSKSRASNYAPKIFAMRPDADSYRKADFERAMQSCFAKRQITNMEYGRKGGEHTRIARL